MATITMATHTHKVSDERLRETALKPPFLVHFILLSVKQLNIPILIYHANIQWCDTRGISY